ncbi:MAG: choice-of-anchor Q domain-containing protein [Pyrinomonadaceae bacterium]
MRTAKLARAFLLCLILITTTASVLLCWPATQNAALNTRTDLSASTIAPVAGTLTVNTGTDVGDTNIGDGNCDTDGNLGNGDQCTLRAAIQEGNFAGGGYTINFNLAAGTVISLNTVLPGFSGNITISGPGSNSLTIQRSTAAGTGNFGILSFAPINGNFTNSVSGVTLSNGNSTLNSFPGDSGGALINSSSCNTSMTDVVIKNSVATNGGGVYNGGTLSLNSVSVTGNTATQGGGIYNTGTLTLTNSTVASNGASGGSGGGIFSNSSLTVTSSTASNNVASVGGGVYSVGTASITNSTISTNNASSLGGGIDNAGPLTLNNVTIADNTATIQGGGLYNPGVGAATINNSILAANTSPSGPDCICANLSGDYNLFSNTSHATVPGTHNVTNTGALLGPLANNGGPTKTHALLVGSPAIDAGNSAQTTDQRSQPRPVDDPTVTNAATSNATDMGAYESHNLEVNTVIDGDDGSCTLLATGNGCTLREAINAANVQTGAEAISFAPALTSGGPATISLLSALPNLSSSMMINGPGSSLMTIRRGPLTGDYRVFTVNSGTVGISGVTVTNGKTPDGAAGTGGSGGNGGGISNTATLTLTDVVVSSNRTGAGGSAAGFGGNGGRGGGIYNSGTLSMTNCVVSGNTAGAGGSGNPPGNGGDGGGLFTSGGTLTMNNCVVSGNTGGQGADGGSFNGNGGTGGGIGSNTSTISLTSVTVTNNVAGNAGIGQGGGGHGGGIGLDGSGTLTISNSTVSANSSGTQTNSPGFGGGIALLSIWVMVADSITVSGNVSTGPGGGIMIQASSSARIVNSTVSGNTAHRGGGLHNDSLAPVNLNNVTITANSATSLQGHGILAPGGPFRIRNSIVAGNGASGSADVNGMFTSQGSNLIGVDGVGFGVGTGFTNGVNNDQVGSSANPLNARLAALGNYGGLTQTHALLPGSPALDAGNNCVNQPAHCSDANIPQLTTDQRGFNRVVNSTVDIGSFESRGFTISVTSGTPQSTVIGSAFGAAFVATVSSSFAEPVAGGVITFSAPTSGASGTFPGSVTSTTAIANGSAVATSPAFTANLIAGSYNVTAGGKGMTTPASFSLTNLKAASSTSVSSSVNPSEFGENVTFTATVNSAVGATPTGTVQFKDGVIDLGSPVTCVASGSTCTAQFSISTLSVGDHNISATYSGDGNLDGSSGSLSSPQVVKPVPTLSINDVSVTEGNSGTANLTFTVTLSAASNLTVSAGYASANGTATTADSDYQSTSGTVTFNPGDLTKTVTILVNGDQKTEPDETVFIVLSNPVNATFSDSQGTGTILNDDTLQLLLDTSGPDANQLAALDSLLLIRDPFRVQNTATWFTSEPNTRVILFALDLQLNSGESPSVVKVILVDGNGQTHEVAADDVRTMPNTTFTQVTFRLPDALAAGTCQAMIKVHDRISNTGTFRIVP